MKNIDGEFKNCNKAFLEFLGVTRDKIIGKTAYEFGDPLEVEKYAKKTDAELIKKTGGVVKYETFVKGKGLKPYQCVLKKKALLKDTSLRTIGIVGTLRDITEDKKKKHSY